MMRATSGWMKRRWLVNHSAVFYVHGPATLAPVDQEDQ